jgi:hypothetical protein
MKTKTGGRSTGTGKNLFGQLQKDGDRAAGAADKAFGTCLQDDIILQDDIEL